MDYTDDFYDDIYQDPDYEDIEQQDIDLEADDKISKGEMESLEAGTNIAQEANQKAKHHSKMKLNQMKSKQKKLTTS